MSSVPAYLLDLLPASHFLQFVFRGRKRGPVDVRNVIPWTGLDSPLYFDNLTTSTMATPNVHGEPEIFTAPPPARPQRPLTAEEKLAQTKFDVESSPKSSEWGDAGGMQRNDTFVEEETGIFARMRAMEATLDKKLGIESHAIERKLPEDRVDLTWKDTLTMATLWASGTMNLSCFATGFLGWKFGLDLK